MATRRPKEPASDAPAKAWNDYDAEVIRAFLREQLATIKRLDNVTGFSASTASKVVDWLKGQIDKHTQR